VTRLDVPDLRELEPGLLGQADAFRAGPGLAEVARSLHGPAVDKVVAGDVEVSVTRVLHGVEDRPAREERALELPVPAVLVAAEQEQPLAGSDEQ